MAKTIPAASPASELKPRPAAKPAPVLPAIGGSRTFAQLEALAKRAAGEAVDAAELHPDDRPPAPAQSVADDPLGR